VVDDVGSSRSGDVAGCGDRHHQPWLQSPSCDPPAEIRRRQARSRRPTRPRRRAIRSSRGSSMARPATTTRGSMAGDRRGTWSVVRCGGRRWGILRRRVDLLREGLGACRRWKRRAAEERRFWIERMAVGRGFSRRCDPGPGEAFAGGSAKSAHQTSLIILPPY
jgi:hypothetical protein